MCVKTFLTWQLFQAFGWSNSSEVLQLVEELPGEACYPPAGPQVDHHSPPPTRLTRPLKIPSLHYSYGRDMPVAYCHDVATICLSNCHALSQRDLYVDVRVAAEGYGLKWERCQKKLFSSSES